MSMLRISIVQTQLHWEDKKANLDMLEQTNCSHPEKTELIVLPEMFSTGFSMNKEVLAETMEGPTVQWMKEIAAKKSTILTGSFIAKEIQNGIPVYYNRLVWMLPTGECGFYDKRHLFALWKRGPALQFGAKTVYRFCKWLEGKPPDLL